MRVAEPLEVEQQVEAQVRVTERDGQQHELAAAAPVRARARHARRRTLQHAGQRHVALDRRRALARSRGGAPGGALPLLAGQRGWPDRADESKRRDVRGVGVALQHEDDYDGRGQRRHASHHIDQPVGAIALASTI